MKDKTKNNIKLEASIVRSSIESAIINNNFHYRIECKNKYIGDLGSKLHIDGYTSRFKIPVGSCSTMSNELLEDTSVIMAPVKATNKYPGTERGSLTNLDGLIHDLLPGPYIVLGENAVSSVSRIKDEKHKSLENCRKLASKLLRRRLMNLSKVWEAGPLLVIKSVQQQGLITLLKQNRVPKSS